MFNDSWTITLILVFYIGIQKFGFWKLSTFLALLFLVEFTLKAALDLLSHAMQAVGLTKLFVLDEKWKLRKEANSAIGVILVCVYFIGLFVALAGLCILLVVDVNKLGKDSMGLIKFDSLLA
jgi:hypothetical protein